MPHDWKSASAHRFPPAIQNVPQMPCWEKAGVGPGINHSNVDLDYQMNLMF